MAQRKIKFWRVYSNYDPAQTDTLFATKKEALAYKKDIEQPGWAVEIDVIERSGPLNKRMVCSIYAAAMR